MCLPFFRQPKFFFTLMSSSFTPLPSPNTGSSSPFNRPGPWNLLPFPNSPDKPFEAPRQAALPAWPSARPSPFITIPAPKLSALPAAPRPPISVSPFPTSTALSQVPHCLSLEQEKSLGSILPDFSDDDLREAFSPIVEDALRKAVYARENGMDTYLEPMLRATIRRALAEYSPASRPFQAPGTFHRLIWHLQALFTSRTYEDILFEKTHRFQVDEVFLVDASSLALVSFASCDPARHASPKRISSTIQRIASQLRDEEGRTRSGFELSDQRTAIAREGSFVCLVAIVQGRSNELVIADLDFALRRIEDRFRAQFLEKGSALLHPLQPFLEDCLLIQAPASAA